MQRLRVWPADLLLDDFRLQCQRISCHRTDMRPRCDNFRRRTGAARVPECVKWRLYWAEHLRHSAEWRPVFQAQHSPLIKHTAKLRDLSMAHA